MTATTNVSPNPSNGIFQMIDFTPGDTYQILNSSGQILMEGANGTIDLGGFEAGIYLLKSSKGQARLIKL
jgi:hypothetical protein